MSTYGQKRLINGNYMNSGNVIARCHLLTHPGYLSKELVKSHECIKKCCPFFQKMKPRYWETIEEAKQKTKENRIKKKESLKSESGRNSLIRETLERSGHIYVTSVKEEKRLITISYIYDVRISLEAEIESLKKQLRKGIRLKSRKGSKENVELLIRKRRRENGEITDLKKAPKVGNITKKRLSCLGIFCLEDLFGRNADDIYEQDCKLSGEIVNKRYLSAYKSAVDFANNVLLPAKNEVEYVENFL